MKKVLTVKLTPDSAQAESLRKTVCIFKDACNWLSEKAFSAQTFNKVILHRLAYKACREKFDGFSSQLVVRSIGVVGDAYRLNKESQRFFHRETAVYDARVLTWKKDHVSIWTVDGRLDIPIQVWNQELFGRTKGEVDLFRRNGKWMLSVTVEVPEATAYEPKGWLGVDFGIVNLATTSNGKIYTGTKIETVRQRYFRHRQRLQTRNTKSSRRKVRKIGNREARFRKDTNHVISKQIVSCAKGTSVGIALEGLKGIRQRTTVSRAQRARHAGWAFAQLRQFVEYKAMELGVPVRVVNPKNTSRECSVCGCVDKRNRISQAEFRCIACAHSENADLNASKVISSRAAVNQPIVSQSGYKPTASVVGS